MRFQPIDLLLIRLGKRQDFKEEPPDIEARDACGLSGADVEDEFVVMFVRKQDVPLEVG